MTTKSRKPRKSLPERAHVPNVSAAEASPTPSKDDAALESRLASLLSRVKSQRDRAPAEPLWLHGGACAISFDLEEGADYLVGRTGDAALLGALGCVRALACAAAAGVQFGGGDTTHPAIDMAQSSPIGTPAEALEGVAILLELAVAAGRASA